MRWIIIFCILTTFSTQFCTANAHTTDKIPIQNLPLITGGEPLQIPQLNQYKTTSLHTFSADDYVGEVDTVGRTWYDVQHNGTVGRMIRYDNFDKIHVCWMNGLESGATNRHIYYNLWDPTIGWVWDGIGIAVESSPRGGYTCLDVDSEGYPHVALHMTSGAITRTAVAVDIFPGAGAFDYWTIPDYQNRAIVWPKITVDRQDRAQLLSSENGGGWATFYCRGEYDTGTMQMTFIDPIEIVRVKTIGSNINSSFVSDRVALVYPQIRTTIQGDSNQYNNDLYMVVSEDGINWDFEHPINITQFIPPDTTLFPDTTAANMDTFRVYTDATILFDQNDDIHLAFTTPGYYAIEGLISVNNSLIWHWSEEMWWTPSLVANGWWGTGATCGAWQRYVQRPCLAEDPNSGDLFVVYMAYDTGDVAANGFPQANIFVSRSTDNGFNWSVGTNITNTSAPGASTGDCWHEREPSCSEWVEDGSLHIFYITDRDAGSIPQNEGAWTWNDCFYQNVPITEIPTTPLVPAYPMHVPVQEVNHPKVPSSFQLSQNYPNPFNPSTTIQFDLNRTDYVTLKVYNTLGREITTLVDARLNPGTYKVPFNAEDLSSGIYFYTLTSSTITQTKKMVLLK